TGIVDVHAGEISLGANYPNPFASVTQFSVTVPYAIDVDVTVYNLIGEKVKRLHSGRLPSGSRTLKWDGRLDDGSLAPSGVYLYELSTDNGFDETRRMVIVR
ncbi:MAG: T9SS type A sorting domain-containing protein, partial [Rhodothermales bacterium]|nr:T9SS type A sorting domain-containing protein [Rhodothermales bacterium]